MDDVDAPQETQTAREAEDARREAEALRRDREKAERAEAKEAERARRDQERAERDATKAAERRQREADRRIRDREKAEREDRERQEREARDAAREAANRLREAERAERAASLAQQRAARDAEKARRQAVRVAASTGPSDDLPTDLPPGIAVLWRAPAVGRPGPRPGLSLEQIADAGIALADAEGLDAVSMSRLAESLGFTTMSLYRYVSSKDEVLSLMSDRASGRPPAIGPELGDWRERLELILSIQQPILRAHPWLARTTAVLHAIGPGRLAWMEGMLAALDGTPLTEAQKVGAIGVLATHQLDQLRVSEQLSTQARTAALGPADGEAPDLGALIGMLATPGAHPALLRAVEAGGFSWGAVDEDALDFGTQLILDGIEKLIAVARSRPQPRLALTTGHGSGAVSDPVATLDA
ncbi:TetR/AcrR family transcriptional regulator [Cellulomonas sp. URHE0023]|uniref:TetR/AcrR family transcriptional regulator n=1 Tax=Cellulomonas sp. URHE0023 TaxID=1380354 RepID=UPI00068C48BD|nr:TetR/AcrR family transcriptional regulator [Cellulomonas sp. URHE0023]